MKIDKDGARLLSIVVPTLNEELYLPYLLASLSKQTFKNLEVIVADAGSKDKTREIAQKWGAKIVNGGRPAKGRNNGAKEARGDSILFLDSDVVLPDFFIEKLLYLYRKRNFNVASCFIDPISDKKIDEAIFGLKNIYYTGMQVVKPQAPGLCIFIEKHLHLKINGFDETIEMNEDWDYINRAGKFGKFDFLRELKIFESTRRFERDGYTKVLMQKILAGTYINLFGNIKRDNSLFSYCFGDYPRKSVDLIKKRYKDFFD
ncbi:MAG: glycosyltransferase [bacterium]|nr:glycosyltransferase [bacterium]